MHCFCYAKASHITKSKMTILHCWLFVIQTLTFTLSLLGQGFGLDFKLLQNHMAIRFRVYGLGLMGCSNLFFFFFFSENVQILWTVSKNGFLSLDLFITHTLASLTCLSVHECFAWAACIDLLMSSRGFEAKRWHLFQGYLTKKYKESLEKQI